VGLKLQVKGESDAFVSAGNTGAQMAVSTVVLRLHASVPRPAIATIFPTAREPLVVVDSGANVDCSPAELVTFARLGAAYAEAVLGRTNACVGLLSIGEEPEKGNAVVKETHQLLATSGLNFQGNIGKSFAHLDYSAYGGAPLLGVNGISIIAHGKSSARALKNAVKVAARAATSRLDEHIGTRLGETGVKA
jgi:glycerol-3-phosphate acyltransferase PlsX